MDHLRELLEQYEKIVDALNKSIDECTRANNLLAIAKAEVIKNRHCKELVQEQIMCEKKLIDATR